MPIERGETLGFIYFGSEPGTSRENHAIAAPSRTTGYAPSDGLGKGLNIPPRQLMRDKLQYSMEGICCQLAISNFDMYPSPWSWRG